MRSYKNYYVLSFITVVAVWFSRAEQLNARAYKTATETTITELNTFWTIETQWEISSSHQQSVNVIIVFFCFIHSLTSSCCNKYLFFFNIIFVNVTFTINFGWRLPNINWIFWIHFIVVIAHDTIFHAFSWHFFFSYFLSTKDTV